MAALVTERKEIGAWRGRAIELPGGWAADLAWSGGSLWLAWAACADPEPGLLAVRDQSWRLREGVTLAEWRKRTSQTPFTVALARLGDDSATSVRELGSSPHAGDGPALAVLPDRRQPAAVWTERRNGAAALLSVVGDGPIETVAEGMGARLNPKAAVDSRGNLTVVWQQWPSHETPDLNVPAILSVVRGEAGWGPPRALSASGQPAWAPAITSGLDGGLWCAWDAWDGTGYQVFARHAPPGADWGPAVQLSESAGWRGYLNLGPDVAAAAGMAWVVWARTTPWGVLNHRFNHIRSLHARLLTAGPNGSLSVTTAPGLPVHGEEGVLPVPALPFTQAHTTAGENEFINPQAPRVRIAPDGNAVVFFRQFHRAHGQYDRGWVTSAVRHTGKDWSAPTRLTDHSGFPDTPYGVVPSDAEGKAWVVAAHAGESPPDPPGNPVSNNRLVVESVRLDEGAPGPRAGLHYPLSGGAVQASRRTSPAAPVRKLTVGARTYDLLYGDLHRHTAYSPCMSATDGDPLDNWRWANDVEELDFYAITDHLETLSYLQWRRVEDMAEALADSGRVLPLLGFELGIPPGHTNFFYADQAVGHDLRVACLSSMGKDLKAVWSKLDSWVPPGKVLAIRHYHTGTHQGDDLIDTYAPRYEQVVEIIQTRYESPDWVRSLWRKGFRVGVVGSSDHSKTAPFPKVLTGLWLPEGERTRDAVMDGLRARRSFATNGVKMSVLLSATGTQGGPTLVMGEEGRVDGAPRLTVDAAGTRTLERVEFYRNDRLLHVETLGTAQARAEHIDSDAPPGEHIYWAQVRQPAEREGSRPNYGVAYTSPVWVTVAKG